MNRSKGWGVSFNSPLLKTKNSMKQKEPKTLEQLNARERMVYDLCKEDSAALNSNTLLCIKFWQKYGKRDDKLIEPSVVELYKIETLTRDRRHLVEWKLLEPKEEIQQKRYEIAQSWKAPDYIKHTQIVWRDGIPYQI